MAVPPQWTRFSLGQFQGWYLSGQAPVHGQTFVGVYRVPPKYPFPVAFSDTTSNVFPLQLVHEP